MEKEALLDLAGEFMGNCRRLDPIDEGLLERLIHGIEEYGRTINNDPKIEKYVASTFMDTLDVLSETAMMFKKTDPDPYVEAQGQLVEALRENLF